MWILNEQLFSRSEEVERKNAKQINRIRTCRQSFRLLWKSHFAINCVTIVRELCCMSIKDCRRTVKIYGALYIQLLLKAIKKFRILRRSFVLAWLQRTLLCTLTNRSGIRTQTHFAWRDLRAVFLIVRFSTACSIGRRDSFTSVQNDWENWCRCTIV